MTYSIDLAQALGRARGRAYDLQLARGRAQQIALATWTRGD